MAITKVSRGLLSTGIVDNSNATAITIDSSEKVGIGNSSPANKLAVNGAISIEGAAAAGISEGLLIDWSTNLARFLTYDSSSGSEIAFFTQPNGGSTTERVRIKEDGGFVLTPAAGGHAVFNEGSIDADFRVESDGNANMLFVDGGNDRVGIGAEPDNFFHIKKGDSGSGTQNNAITPLVIENSTHAMIQFDTPNNVQQGFYFGDPQSSTVGELAYEHNNERYTFYVGGSVKARLSANGLALGTNVDSTAANSLDDYEEGNFTPTFVATGGTAPSGQTGTGQYTKIGDVVHITGQITWTGAGSGGGNMYIALPFAVISDSRAGMAIGLNSGVQHSANHQLHLVPELNASLMYVIETQPDSAGHSHLTYGNVVTSGSDIFSFSGCYHTSA